MNTDIKYRVLGWRLFFSMTPEKGEHLCKECGVKLVFQHSEEFKSNDDYETFTGTWETVDLYTCVNSDCVECGELYSTEELEEKLKL